MDTNQDANHRLVAIVFADMVGYSRLREKVALQFQAEMQALAQECLGPHHGRLVGKTGDGFFAEFFAAFGAVRFALELQERLATRNSALKFDKRFQLRIGIHFGDVVARGEEIDGTNVVIAARTEPLASPGGICMTEQVWEQVQDDLPRPAARLGKLRIKGFRRGLSFYNLYAADAAWLTKLRHRASLFFNWPGRVPAALLMAGALLAFAIWLRPFGEPLLDYIFPPPPEKLLQQAVNELDRFDLEGHTATAIISLQKIIERGAFQHPPPDWMADAHALLAFAYWRRFVQTKSSEDRTKAFNQSAAATNGLSAMAYQVQGLVALKGGNEEEAVRLLGRANELYVGQNSDVLTKLAESFMLLNRPEEAATSLARAYSVEAKPWNAYVTIGKYEYSYATNTLAALTNFEQALRMVPDSPLAWNNLAGVMVDLDKPAEALKSVDALVRKFPKLKQNPEFCSSKGTIYLALSNATAAADWFLAAAALRPTDYRFYGNAGIALIDLSDRQAEARRCFNIAIQKAELLRKDNPDCLILAHIGLYHAALGQTNDAQTAISKALDECGGNSQVRNAAAEAFTRLGATNQLAKLLSESQGNVPGGPSPNPH